MTVLDTAIRKAAKQALAKLGTSVSVRVLTAGSYDTATGAATDTTADTSVKAALRDVRANEVMGLVQLGDRVATVAASALAAAPRPQDRLVIGSSVYEIVEVMTYRAQDSDAAYDVYARGPI